MLQPLIAIGLLGVSLWWYRRNVGEESGRAGAALWVLWVVFGILSLVILAVSGPGALLWGSIWTWVFCVAGTGLGSRLIARAHRNHESDVWRVNTLFGAGSALLVFVLVWTQLQSALLGTS